MRFSKRHTRTQRLHRRKRRRRGKLHGFGVDQGSRNESLGWKKQIAPSSRSFHRPGRLLSGRTVTAFKPILKCSKCIIILSLPAIILGNSPVNTFEIHVDTIIYLQALGSLNQGLISGRSTKNCHRHDLWLRFLLWSDPRPMQIHVHDHHCAIEV